MADIYIEPQSRALWHSLSTALAIVASISLSGCGDKDKKNAPSPPGQVVAIVNGQEITIHELNYEFNHTPNVPENEKTIARQSLVRQLVGQKLLEEKAIEQKLDHQPEVLLELQRARSAVLSHAFMATKISQLPDPAAADIEKYVTSHPEEFAQRQIITLNQIQVLSTSLTPDVKAYLEARNDRHEPDTIGAVESYFKGKGIKYKTDKSSGPVSALPDTVKLYVSKAPIEDVFVLQSGLYSVINIIEKRQLNSLVGDEAKEEARRLLRGQSQNKLIDSLSKKLITESKIEFMGEFKGMPVEPAITVASSPPGTVKK